MSAIADIVGAELLTKDGIKSTEEVVEGKQVIGLYFSAHWCPPCRAFTPQLAGIYKKCLEKEQSLEIIFISSDRSDKEFNEYYGEMPWTAIPYGTKGINNAESQYKVTGIPKLILLNTDGSTISEDGRSLVTNKSEVFPWK